MGKDADSLLDIFSYQQGFFDRAADYAALAERIKNIDEKWGCCSNKLFYLAVPPSLYGDIATRLAESGLAAACGGEAGWTRVIVEKPFGNDAKTAMSLDSLLDKLFKEEQIYRIDHYLGKEMMQNILVFRFANNLFEPSWNKQHVESITVRFWEKIGLEGRGSFYDRVGALRDVGQNHLLQMLALTTMENPGVLEGNLVRQKRAEILNSLKKFSAEDIKTRSIRAQYSGYQAEKDVIAGSTTETYFKLTAFSDDSRWQGVPMVLEAGKYMSEARKEIEIVFKHPVPCFCPVGSDHLFKNAITFQMEPTETITLKLWTKQSDLQMGAMKVEEKDFKLEISKQGGGAYEKLLMDCIAGDQMLFVSSAEIASSWSFTDPIIEGWQKDLAPLESYSFGGDIGAQDKKQ
jgi:glucose-6-phosphate 1-dehydrogenase